MKFRLIYPYALHEKIYAELMKADTEIKNLNAGKLKAPFLKIPIVFRVEGVIHSTPDTDTTTCISVSWGTEKLSLPFPLNKFAPSNSKIEESLARKITRGIEQDLKLPKDKLKIEILKEEKKNV